MGEEEKKREKASVVKRSSLFGAATVPGGSKMNTNDVHNEMDLTDLMH